MAAIYKVRSWKSDCQEEEYNSHQKEMKETAEQKRIKIRWKSIQHKEYIADERRINKEFDNKSKKNRKGHKGRKSRGGKLGKKPKK